MKHLYLRVRFFKSLKADIYPNISIDELEDWDGEKGNYQRGTWTWTCFKSYLDYVVYKDNVYEYRMVVEANIDDCKIINESVRFAFNKVKEYAEAEVKERDLVFNRYQEFLDNGGFHLKSR